MSIPQTPVSAEQALLRFSQDLEDARLALAETRNAEVDAKHAYEAAKRRWLLSAECPKVRRNEWTVAERDAWVEDRAAKEAFAYDIAKVRRQAAADHHQTLREQGSLQQSISKSVLDSYRGNWGAR